MEQCKFCGSAVTGNYCNQCGANLVVKRLTVHGILHEVFHFFTHFDKGYPYTIKKLMTGPGKMQLEYVEGHRSRYQKPFSMFFLSATIAALALYWINSLLVKHFGTDNSGEVAFFHERWVLLQVSLLPLFSLICWLFFRKTGFNLAEIVILQLYSFSFVFILLIFIHLSKFLFPHFNTRFVELPLVLIYCIITNFNFFDKIPKWKNLVLTIFMIAVFYFFATYTQDLLVKLFF